MNMEPVYADAAGDSISANSATVPAGTVKISAAKQQLIGVRIGAVEQKKMATRLRLLGKVAADETRVYFINATVDGWITEALPVATGDRVTNGQTLATFYSPEFLSAGQALLFAVNSQDRIHATGMETAVESNKLAQFQLNLQQFRDSLRNLGMGEAQIEEMMHTRKFIQNVNIVSPADGFISARNISDGLRFDKGTEFFRITDLRRVWILIDVFERDARLLHPHDTVRVSLPHQKFSLTATVSSALPQFNLSTRTLKLRLEADNPDFVLKPDMFVDIEVTAQLPETLVVPVTAVLDAGLRQTVFVARGNGSFEPRVVTTGERSNEEIQILRGLMPGERIVVSGNFLLDSESRMRFAAAGIHGNPSLDPVCGMTVDETRARAEGRTFVHQGVTYLFCNDGCQEKFASGPMKFLPAAAPEMPTGLTESVPAGGPLPVVTLDPVCGMTVNETKARAAGRTFDYDGRTYLFCNDGCKAEFSANPEEYLNQDSVHRDQSHH